MNKCAVASCEALCTWNQCQSGCDPVWVARLHGWWTQKSKYYCPSCAADWGYEADTEGERFLLPVLLVVCSRHTGKSNSNQCPVAQEAQKHPDVLRLSQAGPMGSLRAMRPNMAGPSAQVVVQVGQGLLPGMRLASKLAGCGRCHGAPTLVPLVQEHSGTATAGAMDPGCGASATSTAGAPIRAAAATAASTQQTSPCARPGGSGGAQGLGPSVPPGGRSRASAPSFGRLDAQGLFGNQFPVGRPKATELEALRMVAAQQRPTPNCTYHNHVSRGA